VHTDRAADQSALMVNANAYTIGDNIVFAAGQYSPQTKEGRRLIAHELTHVVQQAPDAGRAGQRGERLYSPIAHNTGQYVARQPKGKTTESTDEKLDALTLSEIEDRARALDKDDPKNRPMLRRLLKAWERKRLVGPARIDADEPLSGMADPRIFGNEYPLPDATPGARMESKKITHYSGVDKVGDGLVLWGFEVGSAKLLSRFKSPLTDLVKNRNWQEGGATGIRIWVTGHASTSSGSDYKNSVISTDRAQAVIDELIRLGIPANRIGISRRGRNSPRENEAGEYSKVLHETDELKCRSCPLPRWTSRLLKISLAP